ncbi:MAG: 16S rRNA (guanine(527)-N(7))-methyltransferase RsmG [Clostridiales bacterium]|nr:16S rRNA (guanine(527)-N(7))-methyltransferase RsmG [Clostridiales bacterium]
MGFEYLHTYGFSTRQIEAFQQYYAFLIQWNRKMSLTTITEARQVEVKHFIDSLLLRQSTIWMGSLQEKGASLRVADVGAGAGFPGVPLKIAHPQIQLDLLEATAKKVGFLQALTEALGLDGVGAVQIRAEEAGQDIRFRQRYDWVLSRGVANLRVLLEFCLPLVRLGGYMAAYKGPAWAQEVREGEAAAALLGGKLIEAMDTSLPDGMGERCILIYKKDRDTPALYPRTTGVPARKPIERKRRGDE